MLIGFAYSSAVLVWIYEHEVQSRPWLGQGIRFGFAVGRQSPASMLMRAQKRHREGVYRVVDF